MNILAFAGSSSIHSINKKLVTYSSFFFDEHTVEILDLNDYEMPLFNGDKLAENGLPQLALDFANKIDESDFILMSLAENNAAYTMWYGNVTIFPFYRKLLRPYCSGQGLEQRMIWSSCPYLS